MDCSGNRTVSGRNGEIMMEELSLLDVQKKCALVEVSGIPISEIG